MKWYVLQVKTGDEIIIRNAIERTGTEALVPRRIVHERQQGKIYTNERKLFPSYVFINIEFNPKIYYRIKRIPGVIRFLGGNNVAQPVAEEEMNFIFSLCSDGELAGISSLVKVGDQIRVLSGPLQGFEGRIVKVDWRHLRARVRLTLFNRPHEVDLGIEVLENETQAESGKEMDAPKMETAPGLP